MRVSLVISPSRRRQGGPTLIELLVVIAIIAVLAAVLFPVFAQARAKARQASCASNLAQIARAGMMYVQDYDERFPSCCSILAPPYVADPRTALQPYVKNWDIFYCPDRRTIMHECLDPMANFRPDSRCMGYGYNWGPSSQKGDGLVRPSKDGTNSVVGVAMAEVVTPSHTSLYGDTNDYLFITLLREVISGVRNDAEPAYSHT
jgi:prepilin-type N-terminal cleavage/methylation domain-containing protein